MEPYPEIIRLSATPFEEGGNRMIALSAADGLDDRGVAVSLPTFFLISLMDGAHSLEQIRDEFQSQFGHKLAMEDLSGLVAQLDQAYFLDNPRYRHAVEESAREFLCAPVRPAAHAGKSYPAEPEELAALIQGQLSARPRADGAWAEAVIVPHIDFRVGAAMMADGWRELPMNPDELIVILGTGHYLANDFFACIDKDFATPLGVVKVDREFLASLRENFGEDIYKNSMSHKTEHSVEFATLFMAARAKNGASQMAVPILLSFPENVWEMDDPVFNGARVDRFIQALGKTAAGCGRKVRYVASVDLAHVGARFGDIDPLSHLKLGMVEKNDRELIATLERIDADDFRIKITQINQENRVCGYPPLHALLKLTAAKRGVMLGYKQNLEGEMENMVSFTTVALY